MIKIKTLLNTWKENEYNKEDIESEENRLRNALCSLWENNLITTEMYKKEKEKLKKAVEEYN